MPVTHDVGAFSWEWRHKLHKKLSMGCLPSTRFVAFGTSWGVKLTNGAAALKGHPLFGLYASAAAEVFPDDVRKKNRLRRSTSASKKNRLRRRGGGWVGLFKNEKRLDSAGADLGEDACLFLSSHRFAFLPPPHLIGFLSPPLSVFRYFLRCFFLCFPLSVVA
jgi:hypothetical protein